MLIVQFYVHVTVHHNKFLYNKTNQMHQFPGKKFYMFRAVPLSIIRSLSTVHSALVHLVGFIIKRSLYIVQCFLV
jgi:hypothetical protein